MEMPYDYVWAMNKGKFLERHYQKKRVNSILSLAQFKDKKVLDVGCNTGILTYLIEKQGASCIGIDISKENIKNALKYRPIKSKCRFFLMSCTKLDFKKEFFDVAVLGDVLEHLTNKERAETLRELKRVVRRRGLILVSVPFKYQPVNRLDFLRQIATTRKVTRELIDNPFTKAELARLFEREGFKVKKIFYSCYFSNIMAVFEK